MNPSLFQLNTRVTLSRQGRNASLDDLPDALFADLSYQGFDWLWLLGVWTISPSSRLVSRSRPDWLTEFRSALPDLAEKDICGSPFAIAGYDVDPALGGDDALARARARMAAHGLKLILDFVPNHVGLDHPWTRTQPSFLIPGSEDDIQKAPRDWCRLPDGRVFAHGRDPNYPGWPDTLQLNYFNLDLREAMVQQLIAIAKKCDGVRCDMAMLMEPEIFHRTWGHVVGKPIDCVPPFWPDCIRRVREVKPDFLFIAEVYWDFEYTLQQIGFDYTYDKTLYDRIVHRHGPHVRGHLIAPPSYQGKMVRFLENHDEPRIASRLTPAEHTAAAVVTFLAPGLRLIHEGQMAGNRIRIPVHLSRGPREKPNPEVAEIYSKLLPTIQSTPVKNGTWNLLDTRQAWPGNPTHENFICYLIEHPLQTFLVVVNYASYRGQCFVRIPDRSWLEGAVEFRDRLSHERLVRSSVDLLERGLFLDCAEWQTHIFAIEHP